MVDDLELRPRTNGNFTDNNEKMSTTPPTMSDETVGDGISYPHAPNTATAEQIIMLQPLTPNYAPTDREPTASDKPMPSQAPEGNIPGVATSAPAPLGGRRWDAPCLPSGAGAPGNAALRAPYSPGDDPPCNNNGTDNNDGSQNGEGSAAALASRECLDPAPPPVHSIEANPLDPSAPHLPSPHDGDHDAAKANQDDNNSDLTTGTSIAERISQLQRQIRERPLTVPSAALRHAPPDSIARRRALADPGARNAFVPRLPPLKHP